MRKLPLVLAFAFVCAVSFAQMQQGFIGPRVTLSTPQTLSNKTLDNDTTVFNGSATQNFSGDDGSFAGVLTTPIIDTPSAAPLVLRCSGTAIVTVDDADGFCATSVRSIPGASLAIQLTDAGVVSFPNQSYVSVYSAAVQSFANDTVARTITFDTETIDARGEWATSTSVFTPAVSGVYLWSFVLIATSAAPIGATASDYYLVAVMENGAAIQWAYTYDVGHNGNIFPDSLGSVPVYCTAGKSYSLSFSHNLDATMNTSYGAKNWCLRIAKFQ